MASEPSTIKHVTYSSGRDGPALLVLGGVHGNETCGPSAIARILTEIDSDAIKLVRGAVTFVPVCNPEAMRQGVRFTERNLNRFLVPTEEPDSYEARLGNMLCPLIEQCDVLLDLHSYPNGNTPFVIFADDVPETRAFALCLGPRMLMNGWEDAYATSPGPQERDPDESIGTIEYATRCGKIAALVECGQHAEATAPEIAYRAILNAFLHLGLIQGDIGPGSESHVVTVRRVVYREREGKFAREWSNFDPVAKEEAIAVYSDGTVLAAPEDGFVVIPWTECPIGQEWYYWGTAYSIAAELLSREEAELDA